MRNVERKIFLGFIIALLVLISFFTVTFRNMRRLIFEGAEVGYSLNILRDVEEVYKTASDLETATRGFIITGKASYVDPFHVATIKVDSQMHHFVDLTQESSRHHSRALRLHQLTHLLITQSELMISLKRQSSLSADSAQIYMEKTKLIMDEIRVIINTIENEERALLNTTNSTRIKEADNTIILYFSSILIVFIILILVYIFIKNELQRRMEAEENLHITKSLLESIIDFSPSIIFTKSVDGKFISVNKVFEKIFNIKREKLIGKSEAELNALPSMIQKISDTDRQVLEKKSSVMYEEDYIVNGEVLTLLIIKFPLFDEKGKVNMISGISTNITERKNIEKQLREYTARIYDLYNNAPCGYHSVGIDDTIVEMNDTELQWLGYRKEEVINKLMLSDIIDQRGVATIRKEVEKLWKGTSEVIKDMEVTFVRKDGSTFLALINSTIIRNANGDPIQSRTVVLDLTDLKKSEEEITQLNKELEQNNQKLLSLNHELESFTYSVSHDLRGPLRAIDGYAKILHEDYARLFDTEGKRVLQVIIDNSRRMSQLIDDLLEFSRISKSGLSSAGIDMNMLVEEVVIEMGLRDRDLELYISHLKPAFGDWTMLKQVWYNLVENSVKYSSKKDKTIINIGYEEDNDRVIYFIKDNGAGFDMRYYHKMFSVFQRLHNDTEFEGTGVGLAIVQRIIKKHGGQVWAESEIGRGSVFYFSLPNYKPKYK